MNKTFKRLSYIALLSTVSVSQINAASAATAADETSTAAINHSYADVRAILPPTPHNLESLECIETGYKDIIARLASTGNSLNVAASASWEDRSYLLETATNMSNNLQYLGVYTDVYYLHSPEGHKGQEQFILNKLYEKYSAATAAATSPVSAGTGAHAIEAKA